MTTQLKVHVQAIVDDEERIRAFFDELIAGLGMRALTEAQVVNVPIQLEKLGVEPFEDEGGISYIQHLVASQMLSTSHVAMHTWPLRSKVELDIYSCRPFRKEVVSSLVQRHFSPNLVRVIDLSWAVENAL